MKKINLYEFVKAKSNANKVGRPQKPFDQCSDKVKSKKAKELSNAVGHEAIYLATQLQINATGKHNSSEIVKEFGIISKILFRNSQIISQPISMVLYACQCA